MFLRYILIPDLDDVGLEKALHDDHFHDPKSRRPYRL